MRATDAYGELLRMDRAIVTTREAAARWQTGQRTAGRRLRTMEETGFLRRLRRGLWALDPDIEALFSGNVDGRGALVVAGRGSKRGSLSRANSHSGFDNDPDTLNSVLWRILGEKPRREFTVRDLQY